MGDVTVEVVTSGLVGCMPVGSLVDRPHTLSTCREQSARTHTCYARKTHNNRVAAMQGGFSKLTNDTCTLECIHT